VFFALFGIFLTQYVPLWMTDNEAQFTNSASTSFLTFKSGVDSQYALGLPPVLGTPFTISSQGIPLIAQPTQGTLTLLAPTCPSGFFKTGTSGASSANFGQPVNPVYCVFENQTLSTGPGGSSVYSQSAASGVLMMTLPNRYYASQTFYYEDDAVVQSQYGGHQIMAFTPPFNVTTVGGNTSVYSSFLVISGNATSIIGQGTEEVYSHLRSDQQFSYNGYNQTFRTFHSFNYTYEIGTQYPCAWSRYITSMMNVSGVPTAQYSFTVSPAVTNCNNPNGLTTVLTLSLTSVNYLSLFIASTLVSVGIGSS
jgi:hypothetical protein